MLTHIHIPKIKTVHSPLPFHFLIKKLKKIQYPQLSTKQIKNKKS